jgi:hypothetical protein
MERNMGNKLIGRFWKCISAYERGATYGEVMAMYFTGKS